MRDGRARWPLVASAALLPILVGVVVNLATDLDLPGFADNPRVVWPALVVLSALSVLVALRLTASAGQAQVVSLAGRVGLLAASARLPADPALLLGRDRELAALRSHFLASGPAGPRVAVLSGPPGVGKSALAVHLAHRLAREFDRRALYADLGGLGAGRRDPAEVLGAFLHALRVPDEAIPAGLAERAALYQSRLAGERALVVLDNAADTGHVAPLLPEGPRAWVLATSRARLATLTGASLVELGVLPEGAAVALLGALAGPERVAADRQAAEEVARMCGGLPLAVRIAAARLRSRPGWTVATLAEHLADRRRRLARLKVEGLEVRASFALSYDELPEAAARTFRLLGLLAGPETTVEVAAALTGDDPAGAKDAVEGLVDAQLLEVVEPGRYRLHGLLYLFAQELAAGEPAEEQRAALERALGWLATRANEADDVLRGEPPTTGQEGDADSAARAFPDRAAALAWLAAERPNLVAAVHLAFEQRLYPLAWQLAAGLDTFFAYRGFWPQWLDSQTVAVQAARAAGNRRAEARTLYNLGYVCRELRRFDEALDSYQQALAIFREMGDHHGEGAALSSLGTVYAELRRFQQAIEHYQQALAISREVGQRHSEGPTLNNLGNVYKELRRFDEALDHYQQALAISREMGDRRGEGSTLHNLGNVYKELRRFDEALDHYQQALAISREVGDRHREGSALHNLGNVYKELRRYEQALDHYQQALAISREVGDRHREGAALHSLGSVYAALHRYEQALDHYQQALAISREVGDRHREGAALHSLGSVYAALRRYEQALDHYQQALATSREVGDRHREGAALHNLGSVYAALHQYEQALDHYQQALATSREAGDRPAEGALSMDLGEVYEAQGRLEKAMLSYEQALAIFEEQGDRLQQGVALAKMGDVARRQRQRGKAISFHTRSLAIFQQLGDRHRQDWALMTLADLAREQGRLEDAAAYEEQRQALPQEPGGAPSS